VLSNPKHMPGVQSFRKVIVIKHNKTKQKTLNQALPSGGRVGRPARCPIGWRRGPSGGPRPGILPAGGEQAALAASLGVESRAWK
jgi:hypothetical protein